MSFDDMVEDQYIRDGRGQQPRPDGFIDNFNRVQRQMYQNSHRKGFHDLDEAIENLTADYGVPADLVQAFREARIAQRLMLIVSELSEALEAVRTGNAPDSHIPAYKGMEAELADAVIRIQDLAQSTNSRLGEAIVVKAAYNANRPHKHGGKRF